MFSRTSHRTTKATNASQQSTASVSHIICNSKATQHKCRSSSYTRACL